MPAHVDMIIDNHFFCDMSHMTEKLLEGQQAFIIKIHFEIPNVLFYLIVNIGLCQ